MPTTILIADAHRLVSDALGRVLGQMEGYVVSTELPQSGQELIAVASRVKPDVVILDYWMPGMEAPAAIRLILASRPSCKILLLSWLHGVDQIREALRAGAVGFLSKSVTVDKLAEAISRAMAGEAPVFEEELDQSVRSISERTYQDDEAWQRLALLTPREIEILKLMDEGRLIDQVAKDLSIKTATVRNHIHNILEKTGTQAHLQALAMARHHGIIRS